MTGYAACVLDMGGGSLHLEIKSVNNRFLDLSFRLADTFRAMELTLRGKITARLQRGKVECRLFFQQGSGGNGNKLNETVLDELRGLEARIRRLLPDARPLSVAEVLAFPGVLRANEEDDASRIEWREELQNATLTLTDRVLDEFVASRAREGEKLIQMIEERGVQMREIIARIVPKIPAAEAEFLEKLRQRMKATFPDNADEFLENRLFQEAALFAGRIDVAEEISRLTAHLDELERICKTGGAIGKRLDFLTQELNREANTLASKSASADITQAAMELKLLIEQIREQAQNIE